MHIDTVERHYESADETGMDLNSSKFIYNQHFTVTEMTSMKKTMWYDWLQYRFKTLKRRLCPTFENVRNTLIFVVLVAMLTKYCKDVYNPPKPHFVQSTSTHSDDAWITELTELDKSISNLKKYYNELNDKQDGLRLKIDDLMQQIEQKSRETNGWKNSMTGELSEIKLRTAEMSALVDSMKMDLEEKKSPKIIPSEEKTEVKTPEPIRPTSTFQLQPIHSKNRPPLSVNVANSLIGASIDETCSSRSVSAKDGFFYDVMSYFGTFQEGYVLLDRELLTPGEAWCTYDKKATLTVKLARYVSPTAVSYQHVRWSGIVPNHAPKLYDLVACLDPCCTQSEPLVTNCEYKASDNGFDEQEQFCFLPPSHNSSPINRVQFRFRENHGNMKKTCAYLVRVYGEPVTPPKEQTMDNGTTSHLETASVITPISEADVE
uniref:SUN domain-containing protein n=1 Tax=Caenorhabditis tropicalis TaxID=1561998 RepID=A0A1I7TXI6_9PELO